MKLKCKINLASSIRRNQDVDQRYTVVEFDLASLTDLERSMLAANVDGESFRHPKTYYWPELPEPTENGLRQTLQAMINAQRVRTFRRDELAEGTTTAPGDYIVTENEPDAVWPPTDYVAWQIVEEGADEVKTVVNLEASVKIMRSKRRQITASMLAVVPKGGREG